MKSGLIFLITSFFQSSLRTTIGENYKFSTKNFLHVVVNNILSLLFYKTNVRSTISEINRILSILTKTQIKIIKNRNYERIAYKPYKKWNMDRVKNAKKMNHIKYYVYTNNLKLC